MTTVMTTPMTGPPTTKTMILKVASVLVSLLLSGCSDTGSSAPGTSSAPDGNTAAQPTSQVQTAVAEVSTAGDYASVWGPTVGSPLPLLAANDHTGTAQSLDSLTGDKGLLLVFSRSADW